MKYLISVVIPCYNSAKTIMGSIESIRKQTIGFEKIQVIAVDDCSKDRTYELLKDISAQETNVVALKTDSQSGSPGPPRDLAINYVEAPYVMFLDSDDTYEPHALECLFDKIEGSDYDVVIGNYYVRQDGSKKVTLGEKNCQTEAYSFDKLTGTEPVIGHFWSGIYKSDVIRENAICFGSGYSGQDIFFQLQYYMSAGDVLYVDEPIVCYLERNDSRAHKLDYRYFIQTAGSYNSIYKLYKNNSCRVISGYPNIDYIFYSLIKCFDISERELAECVRTWWDNLCFLSEEGYCSWYEGLNVLLADACNKEMLYAIDDIKAVRAFEKERLEEMKNIASSRTGRLAAYMQKAVHFIKR